MTTSRWSWFLKALLQVVFPRGFRAEYGAQISQAVADQMHEVRSNGGHGALWVFLRRIFFDLLVSGIRLRIKAVSNGLGEWWRDRNNRNDRRFGVFFSSLISDLRYALRTLLRSPGFTIVAVLTLALGIGANTAIFSVLNGIVLKPLPYEEPERVVYVWRGFFFNKKNVVELEQHTKSYSGLSGIKWVPLTLTGSGAPEELYGGSVSRDHFNILGVAPALGRLFLPEEHEPGRGQVVILSHSLWKQRFGADPKIIGKTIRLSESGMGGSGDEPRTVVGVMPLGYRPISELWQVWLPMSYDALDYSDYEGNKNVAVIGRLAAGVSFERADEEIRSFASRLKTQPGNGWIPEEVVSGARVTPVLDVIVGDIRPKLVLLFAAVGLVLLIGCANVANLLLARGEARSQEIGIRLAIGARRIRLVRQMITEALLLGSVGGFAGLLTAKWMVFLLKVNLPPGVPRVDSVAVDGRVLAFTLALSLLAGLAFGLLPAFRSTRGDIRPALRRGVGGVGTGSRHSKINSCLVVAETALAVVVVIVAGLMLKSFWLLSRVDPGFDTRNLVTMRVSPPSTRYREDENVRTFFARVVENLESAPGVSSVSMINIVPLSGLNVGTLYEVEGSALPEGSRPAQTNVRAVSPGYFGSMGIAVLNGREFHATDVEDLVLVNETMARQIDPHGDGLGVRLAIGDDRLTVIGVVADIHQEGLQVAPRPEMYSSFLNWSPQSMYLLVRTELDASTQIGGLQRAVWSIDEDVPISGARTMEDVIGRSIAGSRFLTQMLMGFAALALVLGAVGVYGVLSYTLGQRRREFGVRIALGASHGTVVRSALGQGAALVTVGIVVGVFGTMVISRFLSRFVFGVSTTDPAIFVTVGLLLMVVAVVASYVPARRASRVDPMIALRLE